ncbi:MULTISPECIES: common pilus major fimbrillin subunit EcpA [Enterobacter]|uniref:Common pilus major fimbrillin subunit EcpA n=2 Tax=Enterobacter TaxID=547 RepID=A0A330GAJ2_ENTCL|nr:MULTISPECIES: common pilus major fimbrillin subunit EcpA [Enterobacter]NBC80689.1 fimbrial protein [Enterobacter asburiae]PNL56020.1 fimbrial protein [Enterobacter hormaechei]HCR0841965.1 fimbrial protein [Enterobacter cancerogenus]EKX4008062.1 fimbrial protein [Enterobacter cloacae]ELV3042317.1 fimbrial protein [Enterobacter chengduensis]
MNKIVLAGIVAAALISSNAMADITASATASWDASATKDTTSALVVTPLKSLTFQYAEGIKAFNTQKGAFDITIEGQSGATDFMLTSQIVSNTLSRTTDASTLDVGVNWNGNALSKTAPVTMIDTANNISAGLDALAVSTAYAGSDRTSAQGNFDFNIESATSDGSTTAQFSDLTDGYWSGDVRVQFTAVWTV